MVTVIATEVAPRGDRKNIAKSLCRDGHVSNGKGFNYSVVVMCYLWQEERVLRFNSTFCCIPKLYNIFDIDLVETCESVLRDKDKIL